MNFKALIGAAFGAFLFSGQAFATTAAPAHYPSPLTCTRNFYVSPSGSDTATCGASAGTNPYGASNCATPWGADAATSIGATGTTLTGGDCVNVLGTTPTETALGSSGWTAYNKTTTATFSRGGTANQANGFITYVCSVNHGCYIGSTANNPINLNAMYIALDGFEIDGHNVQGYTGYKETNTNTYSCNQMFANNSSHHIVMNSIIHSCGAGVLGTSGSNDHDYLIANEAYDFSGVNASHTSGLDFYEELATTGTGTWESDPYVVQIIGNVIHDGGETAAIGAAHTDGEGIILDDWAHTQSLPHTQYTGQALVAYNYVYNIGGKGILQYTSGNGVFENNTLVNNCLDPTVVTNRGCKEFESAGINSLGWNQNGTSSTLQNNLAIRLGTGSQAAYNVVGANATGITHNESFDTVSGGASFQGGLAVAAANPLLGVNPNVANLNGSPRDMHPQSGSPALGSGVTNITSSHFAFMTPDGQTPPSPPNMGAFNVAVAGCGISPLPPCPGLGPVSINAGGPAIAGTPPQASFIADTHFTVVHGGIANNNPTGTVDTTLVVNPAPTAVYRTERWDNPLTYTIDGLTPNKAYSVRLHFTEDWPADEFVGKRIFNIALNGTTVLSNFDIFSTAGAAHKAVVECFSQVADQFGKITITLTATAASVDANAKIDGVEVLNMPTASLSANPATINAGNSSTLTWSSTNSTRCIGTGFSTGTGNPASGSLVVTPSANTTYSISCDAGGVAATASQTVTVSSVLSASLTASPTTVVSGGASTLNWMSNATVKCVGTNFSTSNLTTGTLVVHPTANTTYSIACDSGGTPVNASATVSVSPVTDTISANPSTILNGQSSTLTWSSNGTRCTGVGPGTAPSGMLLVSPTQTTTYTIVCDNGGVSTPASTNVTVNPVTASLSATPPTISMNSVLTNSTGASIGASRSTTSSGAAPAQAYFEVKLGTGISSANTMVGIANSSESLTNFVGVDLNGIGWEWNNGNIFINNAHTNTNFVTGVANDVIGFAVDFTNQKLWVKNVTHSGGWNNDIIANQNPATNTGGYSIAGLNAGPYFITADVGAVNGESLSLNTGPTFNIVTPPSGFTAWGPTTTFDPANTGSPAALSGDNSTLAWSSNGTRCVGTGFPTANAASGTFVVSPTATTTYSVACDAGGATTPANTTVTVNASSSASIMSNVTAVPSNAATISWSSVNASACTGVNFQTNGATSGSVQVTPSITTTYSVTCDTSAPSSVTIIVPRLDCQAGPPLTCSWVNDAPVAAAAAIFIPSCQPGWTSIPGGFCQQALFSGTTWTSPPDWNSSNNTIEGIGAGGGSPVPGYGGGGAEYCKISNFTVANPGVTTVSYTVGQGVAGLAGTNTTWNTSTLLAHGGSPGTGSAGGAGGTGGTGTCNHGGAASSVAPFAASPGAGGAGGPLGVGGAGGGANAAASGGGGGGGNGGGTAGATTTTSTGGNGGNNNSGSGSGTGGLTGVAGVSGTNGGGGGGGGTNAAGGNGGNGNEWSAISVGSGGGPGGFGGGSNLIGSPGLYGAGSLNNGTTATAGAPGVLVLTYHP